MRKSVSFLFVVWFGSLSLLNSDLLGQLQLGPATPFDAANDVGVEGILTIGPGGLEIYHASGSHPPGEQIWYLHRDSADDEFSDPELAPAVINGASPAGWSGSPELSVDGLTLYFHANPLDGNGDQLFTVTRDTLSDPWGNRVKLGPGINSPLNERGPAVSADELEMVVGRWPVFGNYVSQHDLYYSRRPDKESPWGLAEEFPFNVDGQFDGWPTLSPDGLTLFFSSDREPPTETTSWVWVSQRASRDDPWGEPYNLGKPIGGTFDIWMTDISEDGRTLYFFQDGDVGTAMLYSAPIVRRVPGDFDRTGELTAADIDLLTMEIIAGTNNPFYDLNDDSDVDRDDSEVWVHDLANTWFGDADLNGEFNTGDLVQVLGAGKYEIGEEAGWAEGDWDANFIFDSGDLVIALTDGAYERGSKPNMSSVPEPLSLTQFSLGLLGLLALRRRPQRLPCV